jgi:hypothetical protein
MNVMSSYLLLRLFNHIDLHSTDLENVVTDDV